MNSTFVTVMGLFSPLCHVLTDALEDKLYKKVTADSSWWEKTMLPGVATSASSLIMCASQCSNHIECDLFRFKKGVDCQLGKKDQPTEVSVDQLGASLEIHMADDECANLDGEV